MKENIIFALMAVSVLSCTAAQQSQSVTQQTASQQDVYIASELIREVTANPEAAKTKYVNQTIKVRGTVGRTYTSRFLTSNIELVGEGRKVTFVLPYSGLNRGRSQLSDFKPGQVITMEGRVVGITDEVFLLKESVLVE